MTVKLCCWNISENHAAHIILFLMNPNAPNDMKITPDYAWMTAHLYFLASLFSLVKMVEIFHNVHNNDFSVVLLLYIRWAGFASGQNEYFLFSFWAELMIHALFICLVYNRVRQVQWHVVWEYTCGQMWLLGYFVGSHFFEVNVTGQN